ncbi:MAG: FecR domain-containing protein [Gammaproteobacteria bacterium]|nr:FecR domain-containing protein [Gammaproteobacteria bacterium]
MFKQTLNSKFVLVCLFFVCCGNAFAQGDAAGEVEFAKGAATAQRGTQPARIIGKGQRFYQGEILSTSSRSFAVIRLGDGSRLTLRPNTQFVVEDINARQNSNASAVLRLFKGGVRAVTGFISKFNKSGYKLETPVATMGIRGTEFDARLCQGDCEELDENKKPAAPVLNSARVVFARGQVSMSQTGGGRLPVKTGVDINSGDRLVSGRDGIAVLVFPDNSRVTLQPRTEFIIRDYQYDKENADNNKSVLELLQGGLRAVSGLIGKLSADKYEMRTPVATIGIRGTGFDLLCKGRCSEPVAYQWQPENVVDRVLGFLMRSAYAQSLPANGMYAYVWSGEIELGVQGKRIALQENKAAFLTGINAQPLILKTVPSFMLKNPFPQPDKVIADPDKLFSEQLKQPDTKSGLYVAVYSGEVEVNKTRLLKGDSSFTGFADRDTQKLNFIPEIIRNDPFPKPADFNPSVYRLLDALDQPQKNFECEL